MPEDPGNWETYFETSGGDPISSRESLETERNTTVEDVEASVKVESVDVSSLTPRPVVNESEIDAHQCDRCGGEHPVVIRQLTTPIGPYHWWGQCCINGEPILLEVRDGDAGKA